MSTPAQRKANRKKKEHEAKMKKAMATLYPLLTKQDREQLYKEYGVKYTVKSFDEVLKGKGKYNPKLAADVCWVTDKLFTKIFEAHKLLWFTFIDV